MTAFAPRSYDAIVRDLLTVLTGGTAYESIIVPAAAEIPLTDLSSLPVQRISYMEGEIEVNGQPINYRFTGADFELVKSENSEGGYDAVRFREGRQRPRPGSRLQINYYPLEVNRERPVLTDLNVGSVARTLLETFARELAVAYQQLDHVYRSAFLETAEGRALDQVVALVGVQRLQPGVPMAKVLFNRAPGTTGRVSVPARTAVLDADGNRYLTIAPFTLEVGERSRLVQLSGETPATPIVEVNALNRLAILVAGIGDVTNPEPAYKLNAPESDDQLRRRAQFALRAASSGTADAISAGLLAIPGVKGVTITNHPNNVYGTARVDVAFNNEDASTVAEVVRRTEQLRPAGVRVTVNQAQPLTINITVTMLVAGPPLPAADQQEMESAISAALTDHLENLAPGDAVRLGRLVALVMSDERVADASVSLDPSVETIQAEGQVLRVENVEFDTSYEEAAAALTLTVDAEVPVTLVGETTIDQATSAIRARVEAFIPGFQEGDQIDVAGLLNVVRDESQYVLNTQGVTLTITRGDGTFTRLRFDTGGYTLAAGEQLTVGTVRVTEA